MSHNMGTANIAPIRFRPRPTQTLTTPSDHGAGAIEAADERLKEELKARKSSHAQAASPTPSGPEANAKIELQRSTLITARQRRKALEVELQQAKDLESALEHKTALCSKRLENIRSMKKKDAEKERKRQAAFAQKSGVKPVGVKKKLLPALKMRLSGFRATKRDGG